MNEIREVLIGYSRHIKQEDPVYQVVTRLNPFIKDAVRSVLEGVKGETLRIVLSTGKTVEIELFERTPGFLTIRSDAEQMRVLPDSSNSIRIEHDRV